MPYPTNVTWNQAAFALLEAMLEEGQPFTSLDFKKRLRQTAKASVKQADVSAFLQQAYADGHMEDFEMQDNGTFRTYAPAPKVSLWQQIKNFFAPAVEQD